MDNLRAAVEGRHCSLTRLQKTIKESLVVAACEKALDNLSECPFRDKKAASGDAVNHVIATRADSNVVSTDPLDTSKLVDAVRKKVARCQKRAADGEEPAVRAHGNRAFTAAEDQEMLAVVMSLNVLQVSPTLDFLRMVCKSVLKRNDDIPYHTLRHWVKRHKSVISYVKGKVVTKARVHGRVKGIGLYDLVQLWIEELEECSKTMQLLSNPKSVVNVDESRLVVTLGMRHSVKHLTCAAWLKANYEDSQTEQSVSVVPWCGGDGRTYMVVYVFQYDGLVSEDEATQLVSCDEGGGDRLVADSVDPFDCRVLHDLDPSVLDTSTLMNESVENPGENVEYARATVPAAVLEPLWMNEEKRRPARGDKIGSYARYFAFTKTGYVNTALFNNMTWEFQKQWDSVHGAGLHCALVFDNLGAHNSVELHCALMKKGIFPTHLPANTSAFLQPLDDTVFAAMKRSAAVSLAKVKTARLAQGKCIDNMFSSCVAAAEPLWLSEVVIRKSFERTGIAPWSPKQILKRAAEETVAPSATEALLEDMELISPATKRTIPALATAILEASKNCEEEACGGEAGVALMDAPAVTAVVTVNRLHTAEAIREAQARKVEVGKKRKRAREKSKEKKASLKQCSNPTCNIAMDGRKKSGWQQCGNFESAARFMNGEGVLEEPEECLYRVCGDMECVRALIRHQKRCMGHREDGEERTGRGKRRRR